MKISPLAIELLHNNLNKCIVFTQLMYSESIDPNEVLQPLQTWSDELLTLICLMDDMQGVLMSDLTD